LYLTQKIKNSANFKVSIKNINHHSFALSKNGRMLKSIQKYKIYDSFSFQYSILVLIKILQCGRYLNFRRHLGFSNWQQVFFSYFESSYRFMEKTFLHANNSDQNPSLVI
jgi:hypothetical protein